MAADPEETRHHHKETQVSDLPESCLAYAIARTTPRDACRCAAVSPVFRAAADSDHVWRRFIPDDHHHRSVLLLHPSSSDRAAAKARTKDAYLGLCDGGGVPVDGGGCRVWLEKATGAKCYALAARRSAFPGTTASSAGSGPRTQAPACVSYGGWLCRFGEVAELVDCTCLDIYGRLSAATLTSATCYAAYLVYGTAEGHRGLSYPDQETTVAVGGRVLERHCVCLRPDDAETRKFKGAGLAQEGGVAAREEPRRREDGWWEMEMGRLRTTDTPGEEEEVVASFEVFGWYPKRGLMVEGIEFRPPCSARHGLRRGRNDMAFKTTMTARYAISSRKALNTYSSSAVRCPSTCGGTSCPGSALDDRMITIESQIIDAWESMRAGLPKRARKGLDSAFLLTGWHIWKARNSKVFNNCTMTAAAIMENIRQKPMWSAAGAKALGCLVPRE
ncbi:hypothetical protein PR202_ga30738 [Eleusine coracana subsp. coracana]|uniref:F-box domain-containing protein n=1 Tax=Eleusine coracana subsp. coracana TaxID=191504 RepID=A0AAV5DP52_ELECO|nr:hypothetical protein PR202_ga30738 [Eleusine coracana subsp. coracana]